MCRPCLPCLPALLLFLVISGVAPCIQASDGREVLAQEQQWLSSDGLLSVPATITLERGSRLPADCGLPPVATVWPRTLCGDTIRLLHRDSVLLRGTDCRGLLPLPTSPPCILCSLEEAPATFQNLCGNTSRRFQVFPPDAGPVQTTVSAP